MSTEDWLASSPWARIWPDGVDRVILDETDSTMSEAARRAPPARPVWIMARHQTAARGRRGRAWSHPRGNFSATYLFRPDRPAGEAALTSFVAALALADALSAWVAARDISLKWPNDVLVRGRKAAGILLESSGRGARLDWLAVGIGVNLTATPPPAVLEAGAVAPIALAEAGTWPRFEDDRREPEVLLAHLALGLQTSLSIWDDTDFDAIRRLWLSQAARRGRTITARMPGREVTGVFEDLDTDGCLVLRTGEGRQRIAAADVYF